MSTSPFPQLNLEPFHLATAITLRDAAREALLLEHADLDLDHIEPAGMLGDVVKLQAAQDARRVAHGHDVGRQVTRDHRPGADHGVLADGDTRADDDPAAEPRVLHLSSEDGTTWEGDPDGSVLEAVSVSLEVEAVFPSSAPVR